MVKFIGSLLALSSFINAQRNEEAWEENYIRRTSLGRSSSLQFSGWLGPFEYDGVQLIAHGADTGNFNEVLPGPTVGCSIYQPAKAWGYNDFHQICTLVNSLGGLQTDCDGFDDDSNGGLCPNVAGMSMILSYENWGTGQSTGPDVWASDSTFIRETAPVCSSSRDSDGCVFPTHGSSWDDCKAVAHTWSVLVYACSDFNSPDKTPDPNAAATFTGPQDLLGDCSGTDASSLYGCWCQGLANDGHPLMGRPVDDLDAACFEYNHCMRCNSCDTADKSFSAHVTDCNNIDCMGDACCECAADFANAAQGLTSNPANLNLDSNTCVRTIVPPQC